MARATTWWSVRWSGSTSRCSIQTNMNIACHPNYVTKRFFNSITDNYLIGDNGVMEHLHRVPGGDRRTRVTGIDIGRTVFGDRRVLSAALKDDTACARAKTGEEQHQRGAN